MTRSYTLLAFSAFIGLMGGLTWWQTAALHAQPPVAAPAAAHTQWEYTVVYSVTGTGRNQYATLATARGTQRARTLHELYTELGREIDARQFNNTMLFGLLGEQGWELISHSSATLTGEQSADTWTFKRRRR